MLPAKGQMRGHAGSGSFSIDRDEGGREVMVLHEPWSPRHRSVMQDLGVTGLRLSWSAGWSEPSIDFASSLTELRSLEIYSHAVSDLSPIVGLPALEMIGLSCPYRKNIDFSAFKRLRTLYLNWRAGAESLERCGSLHVLNVMNYPYEDLRNLSHLSELRILKLTSSKLKSLEGADSLTSLTYLDLYRCTRLETLAGIESNSALAVLEIDCCKKFSQLRPLQALENLKQISLEDCGTLDSLAPLESLRALQKVFFIGTTTIADGDISLFKTLPALRAMSFMNRKSYSHTREQIADFLAAR